MRFFIALEIPEESRRQLELVQKELQEIVPGTRLTDNQKLHLTIAFLGEKPDRMKDALTQIIQSAVLNIPPFEITPAYIDGFPNLHNANVFWVGVKGDIDKLMVIRERIKDGLVSLGLDTNEKRYIPHISVGKINNSFHLQPQQERKLQEMMMDHFAPICISSIKLFESIPEEGFHTHNTLAEIPLEVTNYAL